MWPNQKQANALLHQSTLSVRRDLRGSTAVENLGSREFVAVGGEKSCCS